MKKKVKNKNAFTRKKLLLSNIDDLFKASNNFAQITYIFKKALLLDSLQEFDLIL